MGERIGFWLRALGHGMNPLDKVARWVAVAVLVLGIAGVTVKLVFDLPWLLTVVILMGLLVVVVLEGSYQVWKATDRERQTAVDELSEKKAGAAAGPPSSVTLRDFPLGDESKFRLRSSADYLAEGGGLSGRAEMDAQHYPGRPEVFGQTVGSDSGQEEPPQTEAGPSGEGDRGAT